MKKVFIIHGWGGSPNEAMHRWFTASLKKKGFDVIAPQMPNPEQPKIDVWLTHLKKTISKIDEQTFFIGHSIGCQAIMRFLETLPEKTKCGGLFLIAPWLHLQNLNDEEKEIAKPWLELPINFGKIKSRAKKIVAIFSDNDPYVLLSDKDIFETVLGAKIIVEHNKGHFTEDDGVKELQIALKELQIALKELLAITNS